MEVKIIKTYKSDSIKIKGGLTAKIGCE